MNEADFADAFVRAAVEAYRLVKASGPEVFLLEDKMAGVEQPYKTTAPVESAAVIVREGEEMQIGLVLADGSVVPLSFRQAIVLRAQVRDWIAACHVDPAFAAQMDRLDSARGWKFEPTSFDKVTL